jgi:hypothetical protein
MPKGVYQRKKRYYRRGQPVTVDKIRKAVEERRVVIQLQYRPHEYGPGHCRVRVWRTDWPGDCFEVLSHQEFDLLTKMCQRFNISLLEADDD